MLISSSFQQRLHRILSNMTYQWEWKSILLNELKEKCNDFIYAVSGHLWDEELNMMTSYWNLNNHHNIDGEEE